MKTGSQRDAGKVRLVLAILFSLFVAFASYQVLDDNSVDRLSELPKTHHHTVLNQAVENDCLDLQSTEMVPPVFPIVPGNESPPNVIHARNQVCPPVPCVEAESLQCVIDNQSGTEFNLPSGSVIDVPPNAFVDATGKPVTKPVSLLVTEYRDFMDIFLSGIPMHYGEKDQLESAGMVRLEANAGGDEVFINRDAKIKVLLESAKAGSEYNLYRFDEQSGKWEVKGKDHVTEKKSKVKKPVVFPAYRTYQPITHHIRLVSYDGLPDERFLLIWKMRPSEFEFNVARTDQSYVEHKALTAMRWRYEGKDAQEVYAKLFNLEPKKEDKARRYGVWESCELVSQNENGTIRLLFKNDQDQLELEVKPADRYQQEPTRMKNRIKKYKALREKRLIVDQKHYKKYQVDSTNYVTRYSTETASTNTLLRSFAVDQFGIWNVDKVMSNASYVTYHVKFVDETGNQVVPYQAYIADGNANTVFTYCFGNNKPEIRLNQEASSVLWFLLPGDRLAVVYSEQLRRLRKSRSPSTLIVEIFDDALASTELIRGKLRI